MRKLLHDFKKKIQDSIYFYFYYIGSQKLCDRHIATISKWQEILENPNHHRKLKRLNNISRKSNLPPSTANNEDEAAKKLDENKENTATTSHQHVSNTQSSSSSSFDSIPIDCKLEIMRRLNCGLDLVNVSKCNRNLNDLISNELKIWKNLCQFHFQQTTINSLVNRVQKPSSSSQSSDSSSASSSSSTNNENSGESDLDWKLIYFRLKRRFGHREVYADMVQKCYHCKSLFWKVRIISKFFYIWD